MKTSPLPLILLATLVSTPGLSFADDQKQGHGAGGVRADHASEKGLEKGKAWAGENEKKAKKDKKAKKAKD